MFVQQFFCGYCSQKGGVLCRVVDPEWFVSDPTPDPDPTFEKVSAPTPGFGKKFRIRPDPDPQHWYYVVLVKFFQRFSSEPDPDTLLDTKNIKPLKCRNFSQQLLWIGIRSDFPFWCLSGSCSKFYTCWKIWKNFQLLFAAMLVYICFIYRIRIHNTDLNSNKIKGLMKKPWLRN